MDLRTLGKWSLRYLLWHVALTVVLTILGYIWPSIGEASLGFVLTMGAANMTLEGFIKSHVAIPSREEYWALVGASTIVAFVLDFALLLTALSVQGAAPLSFVGWALIAGGALLMTVLANMVGYSKLFSGTFLQRRQKKLAKVAAASNSGS